MKSKDNGYSTTVLGAFILLMAYIFIVGTLPVIIERTFWSRWGEGVSSWLNMATLVLLGVFYFVRTARMSDGKLGVFRNITASGILLAVACSVLFFLVLDNFLDPIFDGAFPESAANYQETLAELRRFPVTSFLHVCLFAPITEELLMRGYILTGLCDRVGTKKALVVTTILFAALHFNFVQTLSAAICGLVLGLLYVKTGSLFCCILAHALYNSISLFRHVLG